MHYIVNYSTGLASTEGLERTIEAHGRENTIPLFADVRGYNPSPYAGEDADNYRFMVDVERYFRIEVIRIVEGRDIWQAMFDARAIAMPVGGSRMAPCSKLLKREPIDRWIAERYTPETCIRVFGLDWSEGARMDDLAAVIAPYQAWFPLNNAPYIDKCHIANKWRARGIEPPRLYESGFAHANCGGFCVKAGQAHFAKLYATDPDRYRYHADREKLFLETVNPKAAILRDRRGGETKPITLHEFSERLERGEAYDTDEWGGCGCFAPVQQTRMDDLLLFAEPKR